jgi:porin
MPIRTRLQKGVVLSCIRTWIRGLLAVFAVVAPESATAQSTPLPMPSAAPNAGENGEMMKHPKSLSWTLTYNSDANADLHGGQRTGAAYLQRVGLIADADLGQLFGWQGAKAHASVHAINGRGLSANYIGNILTVSGLEAKPALRLFNLWIEQDLGKGASLRVGQFTAAQEFMISATASVFVNSTFGWPGSFATDLPSGGPAYPLAAPGARLAAMLGKDIAARIAIFAGDPAGPGRGDPQRRDVHGFNSFRLSSAPFVIGEAVRSVGGHDPALLLGAGVWIHFDRFDDLRFDGQGRSLASPTSTGEPLRHDRNVAAYAFADGRLWSGGSRSLHAFVRASASPSDRNPVDLYGDAGLSLRGPLRMRLDDTLGLSVGIARISPRLRALIRDRSAPSGVNEHAPACEAVVEVSYQLKLSPHFYVQPDLQWILHPAASLLSNEVPPQPARSRAIIAGVRTSLTL